MQAQGRPRSVGLLGAAIAATSLACYRVPADQRAVAHVTIEGTHDVDDEELEGKIVTRPSPKLLGLFYGVVYDYERFDRFALRRDLARIERWLRARGFYEAKVHVARVLVHGNKVDVTIEVDQGPPVVVDDVAIEVDASVGEDVRARLRHRVSAILARGIPLDEDKLAEAEKAGLRALTSRGYAAAKSKRRTEVDLATHTARVVLSFEAGPVVRFGRITFEGLGELPEDVAARVFGVEEGQLYSSDALDEGKQALLDLGAFASVEPEPDLSKLETGKAAVKVRVEPAKLRAFRIGGGVEFDSLKSDVHALLGWRSANFLGGLRSLEVRDTPGVVLFPTRLPDVKAPKKLLFENRIVATLRQPAFLERRTTGVSRAEYSIYPVLLPDQGENVVGYHEVRGSVGVERWFAKLFASPSYVLSASFPFDYLGRTPDLDTLVVSYVDLFTYYDLRNDPIHPRRGAYFGNELQLAGGPLQGDATDARVQPEVRGYVPIARRVTLALRGSVGFLFPHNYGKDAQRHYRSSSFDSDAAVARDYQILFFRGFFGGGPTSNRGYPLRGIGPRDVVPYVSPAGQSVTAAGCNPSEPSCVLPTGGLSLWEMNAELRVVISGPFSTAFFCDSGDVSPFTFDIRPDRPHLSCGTGARYDTPVGPIRLDAGYRVPGAQYPRGANGEAEPALLFGAPIALAFGIGEAF